MTFIFACIYAMSNVHFLCRSGSVGIISFLSDKFFYHFLKYGFGWQCFSSNFYILKKYSFFFYFSKIFLLTIEFYQDCYSSPHHVTPLKMSLHCLLTCIVSKERFAVIVVCLPLCGGIFFLSLPPSLLLWFSVVEFLSGWAGFLFCLFVCFGI